MIIFPSLRTKRISVTLREITLGESIAVCRLPSDRPESTTTEFLRRVADDAKAQTPAYVTDPRLWTVEERARLVCHYLSQVSEDGADFAVGKDGKLSDYIRFDADLNTTRVDLGGVAGKVRFLVPLLGAHAEVLERICSSRGDWLHGIIACMVHAADEPLPAFEQLTDVELFDWCRKRMDALRALPESEYEEIEIAWSRGRRELEHFFIVGVDDDGIVFWPQIAEGKESGPQNPARFHAFPCIAKRTRDLFAGAEQPRG